jgi:hypothetical protein
MKRVVRSAVVSVGLGALLFACVLVDPVPELQKPPRRAPAVVKTAVFPDSTRPLVQLPSEFVIPVRVPDPGQGFFWALFIDWNGSSQVYTDFGHVAGSATNPDLYPLRILTRDFPLSVLPTDCHTIEVLVSLEDVHTHQADPAVSDSISWWYVPDGAGTCGLFDAAVLDAPLDDADAADAAGDAGGLPVQ